MNLMESASIQPERGNGGAAISKPLVSVVVPAFNEAEIIERSLKTLCQYMEALEDQYDWELIIVNDGSNDQTGEIAEGFAKTRNQVHVLHHFTNFNVGQALRFAFNHCRGEYVVVMDMDLSYAPEHIGRLLEAITEKRAKIVIASPYMNGGKIANVPWLRKVLSKSANRFLSYTAKGKLSTLTGMVRVYDRKFIQSLSLRSTDVSINAEILYKAMLLRARILEIPGTLDWNPQKEARVERKSSIKIGRSVMAYLLSGFIFRPFIFFIFPGLFLAAVAAFSFFWAFAHTVSHMIGLPISMGSFWIRFSAAVALSFQQAPHTFVIGGVALMLAVQLISLGILSIQNKNYFEELFQLGTDIYKSGKNGKKGHANGF